MIIKCILCGVDVERRSSMQKYCASCFKENRRKTGNEQKKRHHDAWRKLHPIKRAVQKTIEERRARDRILYSNNAEKIKARKRAAYDANPQREHDRQKKYRDKKQEPRTEYNRLWRLAHRAERNESARRYNKKNSEKRKESYKKLRDENPGKLREQNAKWRKANPEKNRERLRKWWADHPEKGVEKHARRRGAIGSFTASELKERFEAMGNRCAHCGATESLTVDHITPLKLGGTNYIDNIQPLCRHCNSSKGARFVG